LNKQKIKIQRALLSVFDKTGIVCLAESLNQHGVEIISTGGTEKTLDNAGLRVTGISTYTGFPEIMDGRVKTINPLVGGGILGLRDKHADDAEANNIDWIDLVVCNLYPFSKMISRADCDLMAAMDNVDIGGPTMIRSAAKNVGWVTAVVDPHDYQNIIDELNELRGISFETRKKLSAKAFGHTAQYDTIIHNYLKDEKLSSDLSLTYNKHSTMRYGENPHQSAAVYQGPNNRSKNILNAKIHQGKQLSYNNIMDADAALTCLKEFDQTACVVVKHANPCGVAIGVELIDVYTRAFNADSLSAFGGIIALNRVCTVTVAEAISRVFVEIVLAPSFEDGALSILSKKKNLRVLEVGEVAARENKLEVRNIDGGILVQDADTSVLTLDEIKTVTKAVPSDSEIKVMLFGWKVLKHVKSNAILLVKDNETIGIGAGQVSRVDAVNIALKKAGKRLDNSILCSDAFFPFRDSIDKIANMGIRAVIQPGGSIRDQEVIAACDDHGIAMAFTGRRCFKH
jgi:phosphoribosylaminoimidazolecarboxamide formyltransferase/IMP cyclohydrolase